MSRSLPLDINTRLILVCGMWIPCEGSSVISILNMITMKPHRSTTNHASAKLAGDGPKNAKKRRAEDDAISFDREDILQWEDPVEGTAVEKLKRIKADLCFLASRVSEAELEGIDPRFLLWKSDCELNNEVCN